LIVIAIIGVLAAIIVPNVTGLSGSGKVEANKAELATVQAAMDTLMAKNNLKTVTAAKATNDMAAFPDTKNPLYPKFLRSQYTLGKYSCDKTGLVSVTEANKPYPSASP
jgi:type IV pilus assembly protein PilA